MLAISSTSAARARSLRNRERQYSPFDDVMDEYWALCRKKEIRSRFEEIHRARQFEVLKRLP